MVSFKTISGTEQVNIRWDCTMVLTHDK